MSDYYYHDSKYNLINSGRVCCYGNVLGTFNTFIMKGLPYTHFILRNRKEITVLGDYIDSKLDSLANVVFLEIAFNGHRLIIAVDLTGESSRLVTSYNKLYQSVIRENLDVNLEISDSMIIATYKGSQALVNQIIETSQEYIIKGYGTELLRIPRPVKVGGTVPTVDISDNPDLMQEAADLQECFADSERAQTEEDTAGAKALSTHRFEVE